MTKTQMTQNSTDRTRAHRRIAKAEDADAVDCNLRRSLLSDAALTEAPHRCPQYLVWLWERHDTIGAAAEVAGCDETTLSRWLGLYGIRDRSERPRSYARMLRYGNVPEDHDLQEAMADD